MKRWVFFAFWMVLLAGVLAPARGQESLRVGSSELELHRIDGRSARDLLGDSDLRTRGGAARYVVLKFSDIPTEVALGRLEAAGVRLVDWLGEAAYWARLEGEVEAKKLERAGVRGVGFPEAAHRLGHELLGPSLPPWIEAGDGMLRVRVYFFEDRHWAPDAALASLGAKVLGGRPDGFGLTVRVPRARIMDLASLPGVQLVRGEAPREELHEYNTLGAIGALYLQGMASGGKALTGRGVKLGMWDGTPYPHGDFGQRLHIMNEDRIEHASRAHGTHVLGIMAGSGLLNPMMAGAAPRAEVYAYSFGSYDGEGQPNEWREMEEAARVHGINISQNSYGLTASAYCKWWDELSYDALGRDYVIDRLADSVPTLALVYSAGNDGGACDRPFGSVMRRAKNVILVGNVTRSGAIHTGEGASSTGPQDDGRLAPHVVAPGVGVRSSVKDNAYDIKTGTSQAAPHVSGVLAQLTELWRRLRGEGSTPRAALLKGIITNTADDLGLPGPDFMYGYGMVNAVAAKEVIENEWYRDTVLHKEEELTIPVVVPEGAWRARVMISWHDRPWKNDYRYGQRALVNDLDLTVKNAGRTILPLVPDGKQPTAPARAMEDHCNNLEQVIVQNPKGTLNIKVKGRIALGQQQHVSVVWYFDMPGFEFRFPRGGEVVAPGMGLVLSWRDLGHPLNLEVRVGPPGADFVPIARRHASPFLKWQAPREVDGLTEVCFKVKVGEEVFFPSTRMYIAPQAGPPEVEVSADGSAKLRWEEAPGADSYRLYRGELGQDDLLRLAEGVEGTEYELPAGSVPPGKTNLFAVEPCFGEVVGIRSETKVAPFCHLAHGETPSLPLVETFVANAPSLWEVEVGENVSVAYVDSRLSDYLGAELIENGRLFHPMIPVVDPDHPQPVDDWNPDDPFASAKGRATLRLRDLDLSAYQGEKIRLAITYQDIHLNDEHDAQLRVLVKDATSGEFVTLPDLAGNASYGPRYSWRRSLSKESIPYVTRVYDLSDHLAKPLSIEIQQTQRITLSSFILSSVRIERADERTDLRLVGYDCKTFGMDLGLEPLRLTVFNRGEREIDRAAIWYRVNGGPSVEEAISKKLPAYELTELEFVNSPDFSSQAEYGEVFNVEVGVKFEGDSQPANDTASFHVVNTGSVYPMRESRVEFLPFSGDKLVRVLERKEVDGSLLLGGTAGALAPVAESMHSTVLLSPKNKGKILVADLRKFESSSNDGLRFYTEWNPEFEYDLPSLDKLAHFDVTGTPDLPKSFVSPMANGCIALSLITPWNTKMPGFALEVREVDQRNMFSLEPATYGGYQEDGKLECRLRVANLTQTEQAVRIKFRVEGEEAFTVLPVNVPAGDTVEISTPEKVMVPRWKARRIEAHIENTDFDISDNYVDFFLANQKCLTKALPYPGKSTSDWISEIHLGGEALALGGKVLRLFDDKVPFEAYRGVESSLTVKNKYKFNSAYSLRLYVDWMGEGDYELVDDVPCPYKSEVALSFTPGAKSTQGYRADTVNARLIYVDSSFKAGPCGEIEGQAIDFRVLLRLLPEHDLALSSVDYPRGETLGTEQVVALTVENRGAEPVEAFAVRIEDLTTGGRNELDVTLPAPLAFGETYEYTEAKLDLSQLGAHELKVEVILPGDLAPENNLSSGWALSVPQSDITKLWAAHFHSYETGEGYLELSVPHYTSSGKVDNRKNHLVEAWVNPEPMDGMSILVEIPAFQLGFSGRNHPQMPDNTLYARVRSDDGQHWLLAWVNLPNTVSPGRWTHIAVDVIKGSIANKNTNFIFMINGELYYKDMQLVSVEGEDAKFYGKGAFWRTDDLRVAHRYDGGLKGLRYMVSGKEPMNTEEVESLAAAMREKWLTRHVTPLEKVGGKPLDLVAEVCFDEGQSDAVGYWDVDGGGFRRMPGLRLDDPEHPFWRRHEEEHLLRGVRVNGQGEPTQYDEDTRTFTMPLPATVSASEAKTTLDSPWPVVEFSVGGSTIPASGVLDLSPTDGVEVKAHAEIYGLELDETYTLKTSLAQRSDAKELLSLKVLAVENPGLEVETELEAPVPSYVEIPLGGLSSRADVKLSYEVSPGATLLIDGQAQAQAQTCVVDMTGLVKLQVKSEVGSVSEPIFLRSKMPVPLGLTLSATEVTLGDGPATYEVEAPEGIHPQIVSGDPQVAVCHDGQVFVLGEGSTTIRAGYQDEVTLSSQSPEVEFTVRPKPATVTPRIASQPFPSGDLEWTFEVDGALQGYDFASELLRRAYRLEDASGPIPDGVLLLPGKYTIAPTQPDLHINGHLLTLKKGEFSVGSHALIYQVTLVCLDQSQPLPGVEVELFGRTYVADEQGEISLRIPYGTWDYVARHEGYAVLESNFMVEADGRIELQLVPLAHTVTYTVADGRGVILGETPQRVPQGGQTTPVTAVPMGGYSFKSWSAEPSGDPTRRETNVTEDHSIEASFKPAYFTLRYRVEGQGTIPSPLATQIKLFGEESDEVSVETDEGYVVYGWDDGRDVYPRKDKATGHASYTALVAPLHGMPFYENFSGSSSLPRWWCNWNFKDPRVVAEVVSDWYGPRLAIDAARADLFANRQLVELRTPPVALSPSSGDVTVSFNYALADYQPEEQKSQAWVDYRLDGGEWVELAALEKKDNFTPYQEVIAQNLLDGKRWIQLRWRYSSIVSNYFWLSEVKLEGDAAPYTVRYHAGEGGLIAQTDGTTHPTVTQTGIEPGTLADTVEAIPNDGFRFTAWDDGWASAKRQDGKEITATASFEPIRPDVQLSYLAVGPGRIEGLTPQLVSEGEMGVSVLAVPDYTVSGAKFVRWDDGRTSPARRDTAWRATTRKALFGVPRNFAWNANDREKVRVLIDGIDNRADIKVDEWTPVAVQVKTTSREWVIVSITCNDQVIYGPDPVAVDGVEVQAQRPGDVRVQMDQVHGDTRLYINVAQSVDLTRPLFTGLRAFPVPVVSHLRLEGLEGASRVEVFSLMGGIVQSIPTNGTPSLIFDLSAQPAGLYLVRVSGPEGSRSIAVVKQ